MKFLFPLALMLIMLLNSSCVFANWTGALELFGQSTSEIRGEESEAKLWGDARFVSDDRKTRFNILFSNKLDHSAQTDLYQLSLHQHFSEAQSLRLGRFQKTDLNGYYLIDGFLYQQKIATHHLQAYAGRPTRIEAFYKAEGEYIAGLESFILPRDITIPASGEAAQGDRQGDAIETKLRHSYRLGMQQLKGDTKFTEWLFDNKSEITNRISLTSHAELITPTSNSRIRYTQKHPEVDTRFNYSVNENVLELATVSSAIPLNNKVQIGLRLNHQQYIDPAVDFKSQFYRFYNQGAQEEYVGSAYYYPRFREKHAIEARYIEREVGEEGRGIAFSSSVYRYGFFLESRLEMLEFIGQDHVGLYIGAKHASTAFSELSLSSVFRVQQSLLRATTQTYGLEVRWDWRPAREWFVYCNAEFITQENYDAEFDLSIPDDEYRLSVGMRKQWDTVRK